MAAEQKVSSVLDRIPNSFPMDKGATLNAWKTWTSFNERFAGIALDTAAKSNEIAAHRAQETIAQLRDITRVYEEPGDYSQAIADFTQAQVNLTRDTMEAYAKLLQQVKDDAAELFTQAGEETAEAAEANAETAVKKTRSQARKAASETKGAAEDVKDAAEAEA
jgi:hypothetical protein